MKSLLWPGGGVDPLLFGDPAEANSSGVDLGPTGSFTNVDGVWAHFVTPGFAPAFFTDFVNMVETQDGREVLPDADTGNAPGAVLTGIYSLQLVYSPAAAIRVTDPTGTNAEYDIALPTLQSLYTTYDYTYDQTTFTTSEGSNGLLVSSILVWDAGISQYKTFAYLAEFDLAGVIRENALEAGHSLATPYAFPGRNIMCGTWSSTVSGNVAANYSKYSIDSPAVLEDTTYWAAGSDYSLLLVCHDGFLVRRYNRTTFAVDAVACNPDGTVIRTIPITSPDGEYQYQGLSLARLVRYPVQTNTPSSARVYNAITDTLYDEYDPAGAATLRLWAFDESYAHGLLTDDTAWPPLPGSVKQHYSVTVNLLTGEWTVGEVVYRQSSENFAVLPAVHAVKYGRARAAA